MENYSSLGLLKSAFICKKIEINCNYYSCLFFIILKMAEKSSQNVDI